MLSFSFFLFFILFLFLFFWLFNLDSRSLSLSKKLSKGLQVTCRILQGPVDSFRWTSLLRAPSVIPGLLCLVPSEAFPGYHWCFFPQWTNSPALLPLSGTLSHYCSNWSMVLPEDPSFCIFFNWMLLISLSPLPWHWIVKPTPLSSPVSLLNSYLSWKNSQLIDVHTLLPHGHCWLSGPLFGWYRVGQK